MKYNEIFRLKEMLEKADIPFDWVENFGYSKKQIERLKKVCPDIIHHYHIMYPNGGDGQTCSAIEGYGTYGSEEDKLEIMGLLTPEEEKCSDVMGYLTAEDVFKRIKAHYNKERKKVGKMKKIKVVDEDTLELKEIEVEDDTVSEEEKYEEYNTLIRTALNCDPDDFYDRYRKYKEYEAKFKEVYEPFKENLIKMHQENPDMPKGVVVGGAKLTYVSPSTRSSIDSKKLKEEEPEIAKKFTKITNVSASIRLEDV